MAEITLECGNVGISLLDVALLHAQPFRSQPIFRQAFSMMRMAFINFSDLCCRCLGSHAPSGCHPAFADLVGGRLIEAGEDPNADIVYTGEISLRPTVVECLDGLQAGTRLVNSQCMISGRPQCP